MQQWAIWDYGIAIGTLAMLFGIFTWTVKFVFNTSVKREERSEQREQALLDTLQRVTTEHSEALRHHTEALHCHSELIEQQSEIIGELSQQVGDVTEMIGYLKSDIKDLKQQVGVVSTNKM